MDYKNMDDCSMIQYTLKYARRKTMAIHITKNVEVEVRAPYHVQKKEIDQFVWSKVDWITKQLTVQKARINGKNTFTFQYGELLRLEGKDYPIIEKSGNRVGFDGEHFFMPPNLTSTEIKHAAIQIYRHMAKKILVQRVMIYADKMNVRPEAVKVNSAKTRWGSCSGKNSLNFSWRLVMAEASVIDYVVVHELAHIKEHNHSAQFWAVVASVMPDYKQKHEGLADLQRKLLAEDWDL